MVDNTAKNDTNLTHTTAKRSSDDIASTPERRGVAGTKAATASSRDQGKKKRPVSITDFMRRRPTKPTKPGKPNKGNVTDKSKRVGFAPDNFITPEKGVGQDSSEQAKDSGRQNEKDEEAAWSDMSSDDEKEADDDHDEEDSAPSTSGDKRTSTKKKNPLNSAPKPSKKTRNAKKDGKSLRQTKLKKGTDGGVKVDLKEIIDQGVVELSLPLQKNKGDPVDQFNSMFAQYMGIINNKGIEAVILSHMTNLQLQPIVTVKDMPDLEKDWNHYANFPNNPFLLYRNSQRKTLTFSFLMGSRVGKVAKIIEDNRGDVQRRLGIYSKLKSIQTVNTEQEVMLVNIPTTLLPEEVKEIVRPVVEAARKLATTNDPGMYPPDEFSPMDIGVVRSKPPGLPYDPSVSQNPRFAYHLQVATGRSTALFALLNYAVYHKLFNQSLGELVRPVMIPKDKGDSTYLQYIGTSISLNNSLTSHPFSGLMDPRAKSTLVGIDQQTTPSIEVSVMDIIRQIEIVGDEGQKKRILVLLYNNYRQVWDLVYVSDTKVKAYFTKWLRFSAGNLYHFIKRRGYTKDSVVGLLKKAFPSSYLKNITASTYDPTTNLAKPMHSVDDYTSSLHRHGVSNTAGLTDAELSLIGIEVPKGSTLPDILESDLKAGDDALFKQDDMSVRSHAKNADGQSVKSSVPLASPLDDRYKFADEEDSSIESEFESREEMDDVLANRLEEVYNLDVSEKKVLLVQLWEKYSAFLNLAVGQGFEWDQIVGFFAKDSAWPHQIILYVLSVLETEVIDTLPGATQMLRFRDHYHPSFGDEGEEDGQQRDDAYVETAATDAANDDSDPMVVDEEVNYDADDDVVVETVYEDESSDSSSELSDHEDNNYFSSKDMDRQCIEPQNQSCFRLLMTLVNNEYDPSTRLTHRLESLAKGAEAVQTCPFVIQPDNAYLLGQQSSPMKLKGIGPGIASRLSSYVTCGFLPAPAGIGTERFLFNPPRTAWQVYYNFYGSNRELMFDAVKEDLEHVASVTATNKDLQAFSLPPEALSDFSSANGQALGMLERSTNGDCRAIRTILERMLTQLEAPCKKICPPFKDKFIPVLEGNKNESEPLSSSATGAPGHSVESEQSRGGSVADEPEDVIG